MSQYINILSNKYLLSAFFALIFAKLLWSVLLFFLPTLPPQPILEEHSYKMDKIEYLADKFLTSDEGEKVEVQAPSDLLKKVKLKALFKNSKESFIVIEAAGKNHYVNLYEKYEGYKLTQLKKKHVIFKKNGKTYKVILEGYKDEKKGK